MTAALKHVEQIRSFTNEGHLYRSGGEHFLVFTGQSGSGWDACRSEFERGYWTFSAPLIAGAPNRSAAVDQLREQLNGQGS
jgi:hypothetical protein